ncbi:hypothetical protein Neosp_003674 [[Neocosmospora] mangrovei]
MAEILEITETLNPKDVSQTSTSTIPSSTGFDPEQTGGGDNTGSDSKGGSTNTGLIAGVVEVVVGIGITAGVFTLVRRRRDRNPDDPEKSHKGFMGVLRQIPRTTMTWSRPPDENKGPNTEVIQKAELSTGPETQVEAKTTTDPETAELETRERPGEEAAIAARSHNAEEKVEEAETNVTQEVAKKDAKTS